MNILPTETRAKIAEMHRAGATQREIAKALRCSRQTVAAYVGNRDRVHALLVKALDELSNYLLSIGRDPDDVDAFMSLYCAIHCSCPMHPEAIPGEDVNEEGCRLCRRDGLGRHHARRKADGRAIVPPWEKHRQHRALHSAEYAEAAKVLRTEARYAAARTNGHVDAETLFEMAASHLLPVVRRFDKSRGVPFEAFAKRRMKGAVLDAIRTIVRRSKKLRVLHREALTERPCDDGKAE